MKSYARGIIILIYIGLISIMPLGVFSDKGVQLQINVISPPDEEEAALGGGGVVPPPPETKVILKGRAYPNAEITILKDGQITLSTEANSKGAFKATITDITAGIYTFGIWAKDSQGRKSVTLSFTVSVLEDHITSISGIFISPTIALIPTQVEKGDDINLSGETFPESKVNLYISSEETIKETEATTEGKWTYKLNTAPLEEGEHKARAKAFFDDGEKSQFSQTLAFLVLPPGALTCQGADLNFDKKVNIIDFSILLYFWKQTSPANPCADINFDGIVNIFDFSIMMYQWTG